MQNHPIATSIEASEEIYGEPESLRGIQSRDCTQPCVNETGSGTRGLQVQGPPDLQSGMGEGILGGPGVGFWVSGV